MCYMPHRKNNLKLNGYVINRFVYVVEYYECAAFGKAMYDYSIQTSIYLYLPRKYIF